MEETTIRQLVDKKIALFRAIDTMDAHQIAKELIELSSLWASVNKELIDRKMWYAEQKKQMLIEHKTATKAEIYAQATPEYRQMLEAEAYSKSVQEMIRSSKRYISLVESEKREARY